MDKRSWSTELTDQDKASSRAPSGGRVNVAEINETDFPDLAPFLARGFGYPHSFFVDLFSRLRRHEAPAGFPRYGYVLRQGARVVGAILLIFSRIGDGDDVHIRCHVTSWCVDPQFRPLASVFFARGLRFKEVAYINVSARDWTRPIIAAQGFATYSHGQFVMSPLINALGLQSGRVRIVHGTQAPDGRHSAFERRLMADHAEFGCICIWCVADGEAYPFVFHPRPIKRLIPAVQLVYCRDMDSFVRFARPLGRALLARGKLLLRADANGPVAGLIGRYVEGVDPRFAKGAKPRLGDLAYTQMAMCPFTRADVTGGRDEG